jgi:hypothetical protein
MVVCVRGNNWRFSGLTEGGHDLPDKTGQQQKLLKCHDLDPAKESSINSGPFKPARERQIHHKT